MASVKWTNPEKKRQRFWKTLETGEEHPEGRGKLYSEELGRTLDRYKLSRAVSTASFVSRAKGSVYSFDFSGETMEEWFKLQVMSNLKRTPEEGPKEFYENLLRLLSELRWERHRRRKPVTMLEDCSIQTYATVDTIPDASFELLLEEGNC